MAYGSRCSFHSERERIIREYPEKGPYYVLYIDFVDFHSISYIYGEKGNKLLRKFEGFLSHGNGENGSIALRRLTEKIFDGSGR